MLLLFFYIFVNFLYRHEVKLKQDTENMIDFIKIVPAKISGNLKTGQQIINGNSAPNTPLIEQQTFMNMQQQYKIMVPELKTFVINCKF